MGDRWREGRPLLDVGSATDSSDEGEGTCKGEMRRGRDREGRDCEAPFEFENPSASRKAIRLGSMVMLVFFTVGGGPLGTEESISAAGPRLGLAAMVIFPWIYCFPVSLLNAEMSTMFPEDGSFTLWVSTCFGRFWAFQDGYWSWVSGVLDSAMYPVLLAEIILGTGNTREPLGVLLVALFALLGAVPNMLGVQIVGHSMIVLGVIVMFPYVLMVLAWFLRLAAHTTSLAPMVGTATANAAAAAAAATSTNLTATMVDAAAMSDGEAPWQPDNLRLLHVVFWSYSGWDSISTFAGEVENPKRTFPLGLGISAVVICLSYILPLLAGLTMPGTPHWSTWEEGSFNEIGRAIGGNMLYDMLVLSSAVSLFALYCAEMFVDSFLLLGMAEQRLMPPVFARRTARGDAPWVAIVASLVVITGLAPVLDFNMLMQINNCLTCLSVLIELFAGVLIRSEQPDPASGQVGALSKALGAAPLEAQFRAPVSNNMMLALICPAFLVVLLVISSTVMSAGLPVQAGVLTLLGLGVLIYPFCVGDLRTD